LWLLGGSASRRTRQAALPRLGGYHGLFEFPAVFSTFITKFDKTTTNKPTCAK
jgi:hypothetical protein